MRRHFGFAATLLLGSTVVPGLAAQEDPRSVEAAITDLQGIGYPRSPRLFSFRGCPQEDPLGRAVFEAVRDLELPAYGRVYLARIFARNTYPDCDFEPLNRWLAQLFRRLHADGQGGPAQHFARGLGPLIEEDLRDALLDAAEDDAFAPVGTRGIFAEAAIRYRPRERQIEEAIAAFARSIPRQVTTNWTYRLGRERGAEFFPALAAAAPTLPVAALMTICGAINVDIDMGRVSPDAPGLPQLNERVRGRPGFDPRFLIRSRPRQSR